MTSPFSRRTTKSLRTLGYTYVRTIAVPAASGDLMWAQGEDAFVFVFDGGLVIRSWSEVMDIVSA